MRVILIFIIYSEIQQEVDDKTDADNADDLALLADKTGRAERLHAQEQAWLISILLLISRFSDLFTRPLETDRKTLLSIVADIKCDLGDLDSSSDIHFLHSLYQAFGDRSKDSS